MTRPTRRSALVITASSFALVGAGAALWPLIDSLNPDANQEKPTEIDLPRVSPGQGGILIWRGKPVFARRRTPTEIEAAQRAPLAELKDQFARNLALPERTKATDNNRTQPGHREWLIVIGVCTHEGCVPKGNSAGDVRGEYGGWFCHCCASKFDTSGRVRKGRAPTNLAVPGYRFASDSRLVFLLPGQRSLDQS